MSSPTPNPVPNPDPSPNPNQADELFALLRARLERHLKEVMENVAVEAATAALGRIEPRRTRLRREARIAAAERDSAVQSLEHITQKYNDLKRMRNIKRVTFVGEA